MGRQLMARLAGIWLFDTWSERIRFLQAGLSAFEAMGLKEDSNQAGSEISAGGFLPAWVRETGKRDEVEAAKVLDRHERIAFDFT
jgi:hypothetical protein